jgi:hypothetical protein
VNCQASDEMPDPLGHWDAVALEPLGIKFNGDPERNVPNALNFSVPGVDSEAAIVALKDIVAVSNGSACTSQKDQNRATPGRCAPGAKAIVRPGSGA